MASDSRIININDIRFFASNSYDETLPLFLSNQNISDGFYKKENESFLVFDNIPYSIDNNLNTKNKDGTIIENKNYVFPIKKHFFYKLIEKIKEKNITTKDLNFKNEIELILIDLFRDALKEKTKNPDRVIKFLLKTTYKNFLNNILNKMIILTYSLNTMGFEIKENNRVTVFNNNGELILTNGILRFFCCFLLNIENIPVIMNYHE